MSKQTRFIMVAGGVISGVGKGVATASIGKILQERGFSVTIIKIDPYINYDAGTLRPTEHGEVWVTDDGGEIDQDLGTYERFLNIDIPKKNNFTTGQIYYQVIERERRGQYLGQTVQFIPHIINEVVDRIKAAADGYDIAIIEVGGTVGDYENVPFLFAIKALEREFGTSAVAYVLVSYFPVPNHIYEMKTKPTQQAVREMNEQGIFPDFIVCRAEMHIDDVRKKKIEEYAHIPFDHLIAAPNVESIYQMPLIFEAQNFGDMLLKKLELTSKKEANWAEWRAKVATLLQKEQVVKIGIVGKYLGIGDFSLTDTYLSIYHAILHASVACGVSAELVWLNAQDFEDKDASYEVFDTIDAVIVPGGFGASGVEGKINVIRYLRTHNKPYLGICYGMQLAVVEYARSVCNLSDAHTTEVNEKTANPVVVILPTQQKKMQEHRYGASMRLGAYTCEIDETSKVYELYQKQGRILKMDGVSMVKERHRHRYEVNPDFIDLLEKRGMKFSGFTFADDTRLMEFLELPEHPFFVATQAHPEFSSRFENPQPLFVGFIRAAIEQRNKKD